MKENKRKIDKKVKWHGYKSSKSKWCKFTKTNRIKEKNWKQQKGK